MCAKLLLLWQMKMKSGECVCKAFVIVENEESVKSGECVCKAFVIVEIEECVQSFCYCGK